MPPWFWQVAWALALAGLGLPLAGAVGAPALPGFARFTRDEVLRHECRSGLFECVRADPGVSFGRLCARAGTASGTAQHHLRLLGHHHLVRRLREGRSTRF